MQDEETETETETEAKTRFYSNFADLLDEIREKINCEKPWIYIHIEKKK